MKKIISILMVLALMITVLTAGMATTTAAETATITIYGIDGTTEVKDVNVGDEFTVYTTLNVSASAANGWEMDAIAAVAIGGTSMTGGRGKIMGTFLGVLMFRIISNVLTVADISSYLNGAISAAIIVLAVLMQNFQNKRR
jgi:ABC-type glucose/galactose transport system permease subunit